MSLSSLIVQRGIASHREIEEALARQVLYGGDFVTNLFEVSRIEEAALMPVIADFHSLATAPIGELPKAPAEAIRLVATDVVAERGFAPLQVGPTLVIAVAEPLEAEVEQELTFALALPIEQRIAPRFRIKQALARDYGIPLEKRIARLIAKVVQKGPTMASTFPPPRETSPAFRAPPRPPSIAPPPARVPQIQQPAAPSPASVKGTFVRDKEAAPLPAVRRRRGPLTMDIARAELEASAERDAIFDLLFEFARQFFDYTAFFIVHGDIAEGRDAFGDGASREKVARVGVPLDLQNILATARGEKRSYRGYPHTEGLDPVLLADLGRDGKSECIVFPVVVRTRVVALLFGDGGVSGIDDESVRQVELLLDAAGGAFERVIVRRKLRTDAKGERGVAVAQKKAEDSVAPPANKVSAPPPSNDGNEETRARSKRPSLEELAAPIQELLAEPVSEVAQTTRDPEPAPTSVRPSDHPPPPPNLLQVRRPSGRPIPREEPSSSQKLEVSLPPPTKLTPALGMMAVGGPLSGAAALAATPLSSPPGPGDSNPPAGPKRTKSQSMKRAQAPQFEFGSPAVPKIVTESNRPPEGRRSEGPRTTREAEGGAWASEVAAATSASTSSSASAVPSQVHPWADAAEQSPRAASPPPMRAAPITDLSPQPIFSVGEPGTSSGMSTVPATKASTTLTSGSPYLPMLQPPTETTSAREVPPVEVVPSPAETDPNWLDPDATPLAPPVDDPEFLLTPHVPSVEPEPNSGEPVLPLSQRKGASPPSSKAPRSKKPMPPSQQQISVAAHRPPSSRSDHSRVLPSIIVDTTSEFDDLVERVITSGDEDAEAQLLRAGGYAMPAIIARFPGPISVEPERIEGGQIPRVAECGPVLKLVAMQRRTALSFVLTRVDSPDVDTRIWSTYLLSELIYADAVEAAVGRVFDDDARVRRVARAAIRALAEVHPGPVVERLGEIAKSTSDARRVRAIEALGEAREPQAVPVLLTLIEDAQEPIVNAARAALVLITQQDFARDADRWIAWWGENLERHRLEWLIDALMSDQRALRTSASEELKAITKEFFGYYDDLPKRERLAAQARYRDWWENIGRVRFSRASTRGAS